MKKEELICYEGKKIKIFLKNNFNYTGKVLQLNEDSILILDKFNLRVTISNDDIMSITEDNGGYR